MLSVWQSIPNAVDQKSANPSADVALDELGFCPPNWMPEPLAAWLISVMTSYPKIERWLFYLLERVDAPSAFEHRIRRLATLERKHGPNGLFYINDPWSDRGSRRLEISSESRQRLMAVWSDANEAREERKHAFRYWLISARTTDIELLRTIEPGSAIYSQALRKRMQLRDFSTIDELRVCLSRESTLLRDLPPVWSLALLDSVVEVFRTNAEAFRLSETEIASIFLSLPPEHAEAMIVQLWPVYGSEPEFQATALLLGTSKCQTLVAEAVGVQGSYDRILKAAHFIMMVSWPYLDSQRLLPVWMDRCAPFLKLASQETLYSFEINCHSPEAWRWYGKCVRPLLHPEAKTDTHKRLDLVAIEAGYRNGNDAYHCAYSFFEEVERRGANKQEILGRIAAEATSNPTSQNMSWLAACIAIAGERHNMDLLQREFLNVSAHELEKLRRDCFFYLKRKAPSNSGTPRRT